MLQNLDILKREADDVFSWEVYTSIFYLYESNKFLKSAKMSCSVKVCCGLDKVTESLSP